MHPELLLLSAQIALLVLIASLVAFAIGWMLRGGRAQAGAEAEAKLTQASQEIESLKASLASTEQQCMTTLEQRDEAERQASQSAAEVRLLGDELARLNTASISITDHQAQLDQARAAALQSIEANAARL